MAKFTACPDCLAKGLDSSLKVRNSEVIENTLTRDARCEVCGYRETIELRVRRRERVSPGLVGSREDHVIDVLHAESQNNS